MRCLLAALALLCCGAASASTPAEFFQAALADAESVYAREGPARSARTRYQTLWPVPVADQERLLNVLTFHLWQLSREYTSRKPVLIAPGLVRFNLDDYGIDPVTYGNLRLADPYFHLFLTRDGKKPEAEPVYAPWCGDPRVVGRLSYLLGGSQVAMLRADWFIAQTSVQDGRNETETGYYDFLKIKNRADFEKLSGLDLKLAQARRSEFAAIVKDSGVSYFPRQIFRLGAVDSGYWFTKDPLDDSRAARNALRQLDGDFKHQAERIFGVGPNGLFVYFLGDDKGVRQDAAPDKVGPDRTRKGNRTRIEICRGCIGCHEEGLNPIDSWVDETLRDPFTAEVSPEKARRLDQLYFTPLKKHLDRDNALFAERVKECNGYTLKENTSAFVAVWDGYVEGTLTLDDGAREYGVTVERLRRALLAVQAQGKLDPIFADWLRGRTMRRDNFEEVYAAGMVYLGGSP